MSLLVYGSIQEARFFRLQFNSLAHRWNARAFISDGESQEVLTLLRTLTQRPLLPADWSMRGGFELDARASGRHWPERGDNWMHFLDKATLTLTHRPIEKEPAGPALELLGVLAYKNGEVTGSHLAFNSPWLDGKGRATLSLGEEPGKSPMTLEATLLPGKIGRWPYQDGGPPMKRGRDGTPDGVGG